MRIFGKKKQTYQRNYEKEEPLQQIRQNIKIMLPFVSFLFYLIVFKDSNSFSFDGLI